MLGRRIWSKTESRSLSSFPSSSVHSSFSFFNSIYYFCISPFEWNARQEKERDKKRNNKQEIKHLAYWNSAAAASYSSSSSVRKEKKMFILSEWKTEQCRKETDIEIQKCFMWLQCVVINFSLSLALKPQAQIICMENWLEFLWFDIIETKFIALPELYVNLDFAASTLFCIHFSLNMNMRLMFFFNILLILLFLKRQRKREKQINMCNVFDERSMFYMQHIFMCKLAAVWHIEKPTTPFWRVSFTRVSFFSVWFLVSFVGVFRMVYEFHENELSSLYAAATIW